MKIRKLMISYILVSFLWLVFTPLSLFGYDNKIGDVHDSASKKAWNNVIGKGDFLKDLGLAESDLLYEGKRAKDWVAQGSRNEDEPIIRSVNHFYDPVQKIGLNDPCGFPNILNIPIFPSPSWGLGYVPLLNAWDIKDARRYEYIALTGKELDGSPVSDAQDDTGRKMYFAHMFRAVGQVMHLVEDCAVPEHVRNDAHALPGDRSLYEAYASTNKGLLKYDGYPLVKFPAYDCYFDTSLSACSMANTGRGLAEFTNRNFVSQSTNFDDRGLCRQVAGIYSQPQYDPLMIFDEQEFIPQLGRSIWVLYAGNMVSDYYTGTETLNQHLTALSWWNFETEKLGKFSYSLNDKCFQSTADFVIPRAVGYSAGLLDYFFRGKLEMPPSEDCSGYVIENNTEEEMNGTFELYYDNTSNERKQCWSGSFALGAWSSSDTITFTPPDDAKEPDKYILVFQGRLGNEDGAVVGAVANLAPSAFVLLTQTSLRLDVLGEGVNNATILVDGEILGIVSGGLGKINDETLEIENEGEGDLYINGQLITDKKWTYKNWFDATGWPNRWEVSHKPSTVVKLRVSFVHEGQEYYLMPTGVGTIRYTQPAIMPMEILLGNDVEVYHQCEKDYPCDELSFYYTFTGELEGVSFDVQYRLGEDFYSDNFPPDGVICCYGNHICRGTKVPEYGWDQCYPSIDGSCYPKDGDYELHILNNQAGSRWTQKYYEEYHGALNFGEWLIGPCYEEYDTLRPTECIVNDSSLVNCYVLGCDREYKAISPSEYRTYYKIRGSSLESLFLEKGYPLIERDVDITITGVDNRVL